MHWGLTAFERKRIERIALDHPYFDMHAPLLTKKELRTILAQDPRKTGSQVVAEVKKELGIAYAPATQKKRTLAEALRDASFVPSFRRTIVLGIFCLLLVLFMTFTVPGKTFAEEVYSLIVNYINHSLRAYSDSFSSSQYDYDFLSIPENLSSPKALSDEINNPIAITDDELLSFRYAPEDSHSLMIRSKYQDKHGKIYVLQQEIYSDKTLWGYGADMGGNSSKLQSGIGIALYEGLSEDGTNILAGFTDHVVIQLSSKQFTMSELVQVARKMVYAS